MIMGTHTSDLEQMMRTLAAASKDPHAITVGQFAKAVECLQAELQMLESEVDKLGGTLDKAFAPDTDSIATATKPEATSGAARVQAEA